VRLGDPAEELVDEDDVVELVERLRPQVGDLEDREHVPGEG